MTLLLCLTMLASVASQDRLMMAIEQVESGGRADAVGDGGKAVGCLQMHRIAVDEANRIIGEKRFTYKDRLSKSKSYEMYRIITGRWAGASDEVIARRWNGGPRGEKKQATLKYWVRVQSELESK